MAFKTAILAMTSDLRAAARKFENTAEMGFLRSFLYRLSCLSPIIYDVFIIKRASYLIFNPWIVKTSI